ncbi:peptide chain release factor family protein [Singulisphaera sp. PoT]|uniref:peptide chain release factor family protein n=1 Tax=Singulisphaera sp. PoT TaxID=3411797 RepID=UPI003BF56753
MSQSSGGHPADTDPDRLVAECDVQRTRRSGPGGQNRNKVETAIVLVHRPTGIRAEANERRSQLENLKIAVFRLRLNLALSVRMVRDDARIPSRLWSSRCRGEKIAVSTEHDDFPSLLAEALDIIEAAEMDLPAAAARLGCTGSQLLKLLKGEPRALALVNANRQRLGLRNLL